MHDKGATLARADGSSTTGWRRLFATGADRPVVAGTEEISRLYHRHRLRVMLAITFGYAIAYTCRLALNVVKKPLIDAGVFSPSELGLIGSALFYTYALGKLVNGFLADHANLKVFFGALGAQRLVPGLRRSRRRRRHDELVQQSRARALLRHLEHRTLDR
jgi:hypothetical protein